jgi:hypothetical protein
MRILYIDPNIQQLNPTANLFPGLIESRFPDFSRYGPGFVEENILERGIISFIEFSGPFDVVIFGAGTSFFNQSSAEDSKVAKAVCRTASGLIFPDSLSHFYADVRESCGDIPCSLKLLSALNLDYYASTQNQIDVLLENDISIIGPNHQFVIAIEDLPEFALREKHYQAKKSVFSDKWKDFLNDHPHKVVTAVHFVGPDEYCYDPLSMRSCEVAIPGVEYVLRKEAIQALSKSDYKTNLKIYFKLYLIANKLGIPVFSHPILLRLYNLLFQKTLFESKCIYTAKGGFGIPVRKFFEIPAAGCLMICSPPNSFKELGFEHNVNYINAEPSGLNEALEYWLDNPKAQAIANAGQQLIKQKHSLSSRGDQIEKCIRAMVSGNYKGSHWRDGEFIIDYLEKK